jgi:hypothetical protein
MKNILLFSAATLSLILAPAALAGGSCSSAKAEKIQTAQADGAACSTAKTVQVAMADGASCSTKKAVQVAMADGASCSTAKATKVALADGASCEASSKAIQVAQKSDCETSCDSKDEKIVMAKADTKASAEDCGGCEKAMAAPAVAKQVAEASVVASAQD